MTPAVPNHLKSPNAMAWQPIPSSAAINSVRNGNTSSRNTFDDLKNKPFYGVRPTLNVQLNSNDNMHKKLISPHYSNETGSTLLSLRNSIMPTPFMRDNFGWTNPIKKLRSITWMNATRKPYNYKLHILMTMTISDNWYPQPHTGQKTLIFTQTNEHYLFYYKSIYEFLRVLLTLYRTIIVIYRV